MPKFFVKQISLPGKLCVEDDMTLNSQGLQPEIAAF
jgi:hypothetical protein